MKPSISPIFYIIPREEEKYKNFFANGNIWNNNLWFPPKLYTEIINHWQTIIKEQKEEYKKTDKELTEKLETGKENLRINLNQEPDREKQRYKAWLFDNFSLFTYKSYLKKFPEFETWQENLKNWEIQSRILNKYEIRLKEQTNNKIIFDYFIPYNEKLGGLIINDLNNRLFCHLGIWYEVENYKKITWQIVEVTVTYSYYWNDYWYLLRANANGVIHNSPYLQTEICACPSFLEEEQKVANTFIATNYELSFNLWRFIGKEEGWFKYEKQVQGSGSDDFPWFKVGEWKRLIPSESTDWKSIIENKSGEIFSLISKSYEGGSLPGHISKELKAYTGKDGKSLSFKGKIVSESISLRDWLNENYPVELNHCRTNHIWSALYWRDRTIWQGNYHRIRKLEIIETANPSGTHVTFLANGNVIASVHESIFIKIGASKSVNVILQTVISTAAGAAIGAATGGTGAAFAAKSAALIQSAVIAGAAKGAVAGGLGAAAGALKSLSDVENIRQEFTIDEFQHKWATSGIYPIGIVLEQNSELINRYRANRTLKKGGEGNEYFNSFTFGNYLTKEGFHKFHFLTLNMFGNNRQWFKEKLEEGVWVSDSSLKDWYELKLPRNRIADSSASSYGDLEEVIISEELSGSSGWDNSSHLGEGCWVYKDSYIRNDRNQDLMKDWLMPLYKSRMTRYDDSDKWVFKHPDNFVNIHDIPSKYFEPDKDYVRVDYYLHFYSSNEPPIINQELHAKQVKIERISEGNKGIITITIIGHMKYKRKMTRETPEGFGNPPSPFSPSGGIPEVPVNEVDPNSPDINIPEPTPSDPTGGEPEIPTEPEIPEQEPPIDEDPPEVEPPEIDPPYDDDPPEDEEKPEDFD